MDKALIQRTSKCQPLCIDDLKRAYTNQWIKFHNAERFASRYTGVADSENQVLHDVNPIPDEKKIHFSLQWQTNTTNDMYHRFENLGQKAVNVTFKVLKSNIESFATIKVIEGHNITCDFLGNSFGELNTVYYVHSHDAQTMCSSNCQKRNLETLFDSADIDHNQYTSVYISSVFLKLRSLINQILKNPNFGLFSQFHFFTIAFDAVGNAFIHGIIWPHHLVTYNEGLQDESYGLEFDQTLETLYENFVNTNFSTSQ